MVCSNLCKLFRLYMTGMRLCLLYKTVYDVWNCLCCGELCIMES